MWMIPKEIISHCKTHRHNIILCFAFLLLRNYCFIRRRHLDSLTQLHTNSQIFTPKHSMTRIYTHTNTLNSTISQLYPLTCILIFMCRHIHRYLNYTSHIQRLYTNPHIFTQLNSQTLTYSLTRTALCLTFQVLQTSFISNT